MGPDDYPGLITVGPRKRQIRPCDLRIGDRYLSNECPDLCARRLRPVPPLPALGGLVLAQRAPWPHPARDLLAVATPRRARLAPRARGRPCGLRHAPRLRPGGLPPQ